MALTSCCGCISLRIGTIILASVAAIFSLAAFVDGIIGRDIFLIIQGVGILIYCLCIYAVIEEKAALMIPSLIWSMISVLLSIISLVLVVIAYILMISFPPRERIPEHEALLAYVQTVMIVFIIIFIIFTGITLYFWFVTYALYKVFKNGSGDPIIQYKV